MQSTSHGLGLTSNDYFLNILQGRKGASVSAQNHIPYLCIQQPLWWWFENACRNQITSLLNCLAARLRGCGYFYRSEGNWTSYRGTEGITIYNRLSVVDDESDYRKSTRCESYLLTNGKTPTEINILTKNPAIRHPARRVQREQATKAITCQYRATSLPLCLSSRQVLMPWSEQRG